MPTRREIKGVLDGFSSSFVSRNNDIDGYWGLGQLYKHAVSHNTNQVVIDVLSNDIVPPNPRFRPYIDAYAKSILTNFSSRSLPHNWLTQATVTINFNQFDKEDHPLLRYQGEPFLGTIEFVDDLSRKRSVEIRGRCRKHDVSREQRAVRD